jgi:hypothetical protein
MEDQKNNDDNGNWYAQQPKQNSTSHGCLLIYTPDNPEDGTIVPYQARRFPQQTLMFSGKGWEFGDFTFAGPIQFCASPV